MTDSEGPASIFFFLLYFCSAWPIFLEPRRTYHGFAKRGITSRFFRVSGLRGMSHGVMLQGMRSCCHMLQVVSSARLRGMNSLHPAQY